MKTIFFFQIRLNSTRSRFKVMKKVKRKPLLYLLIDNILFTDRIDQVIRKKFKSDVINNRRVSINNV